MNSTPIYGAPFVREDGKRVTHGIREPAGVFCKATTGTLAVDPICPIPFNSTSGGAAVKAREDEAKFVSPSEGGGDRVPSTRQMIRTTTQTDTRGIPNFPIVTSRDFPAMARRIRYTSGFAQ